MLLLPLVLSKKTKTIVEEAWIELVTVFVGNPAGLRSRLSKAVEPPEERAGQANPLHEQSIRDDPYSSTNKQTNTSQVRYSLQVRSSYCRRMVSFNKSRCPEVFTVVYFPCFSRKRKIRYTECALTKCLKDHFLQTQVSNIKQ